MENNRKSYYMNGYGTVNVLNYNKNNRPQKLIRHKGILILALGSVMFISGLFIGNKLNNRPYIEPDKVATSITLNIEEGEQFDKDIMSFYNEDYKSMYKTAKDYKKSILKQNNKFSDDLTESEKLDVTIIIDKDNPYYQRMVELEKEINDINENDYWVEYTVKPGEFVSTLAAKSCANDDEIYGQVINQIKAKNNLDSYGSVYEGQKLYIPNPKLGDLKIELNKVRENLIESLKNQNPSELAQNSGKSK